MTNQITILDTSRLRPLVQRHPSEIRVGDLINHAGSIAEVTHRDFNPRTGRWRFDLWLTYDRSSTWVFYSDDDPIRRFEE